MEENLKKLEELLGKKYEEWTQETLTELLNSEEALSLFTPEMVVFLLLNKQNKKVFKTLLPVKFGYDIRAAKSKIEESLVALKEKKISQEEYRVKVLEIKKIDNPIYVAAVHLTEIASFGEDYDISKEEKEMTDNLMKVKDLIKSISLDEGFQVVLEILDIVFPIRELYFQRTKVDLLKDEKYFDETIKIMNEKIKGIMQAFEEMKKEMPTEEKQEDK
jgi:hypothetical protein